MLRHPPNTKVFTSNVAANSHWPNKGASKPAAPGALFFTQQMETGNQRASFPATLLSKKEMNPPAELAPFQNSAGKYSQTSWPFAQSSENKRQESFQWENKTEQPLNPPSQFVHQQAVSQGNIMAAAPITKTANDKPGQPVLEKTEADDNICIGKCERKSMMAANAEPPDDLAQKAFPADGRDGKLMAKRSTDFYMTGSPGTVADSTFQINRTSNSQPFIHRNSIYASVEHDDKGKSDGRKTGHAITDFFQYHRESNPVNNIYRKAGAGPDANFTHLGHAKQNLRSSTTMIQRGTDEKIHTAIPRVPALDAGYEAGLMEIMTRPVADGDMSSADVRVAEFENLIFDAGEEVHAALYARLSLKRPPASDKFAARFKYVFSRRTRARLLKWFKDTGAYYYRDESAAKAPTADLWKELAPGRKTKEVHSLGRIDAPDGVYLRSKPFGTKDGPLLPFDTLVMVERETIEKKGDHPWIFVVALGDAGDNGNITGSGFIEAYFAATNAPEPTAHLHLVKPGELLKDIAARYYKHSFSWGNDARLYVQAIYHANKDRDVVFRQKTDLTVDRRALETDNIDTALELWKQARVVQGQALWMPSQDFVGKLKAAGVINGASISKLMGTALWDATVGAVMELIDWAQYTAGFVIGLLEGVYEALADLFTGVVDLIKAIWSVVKALFGDFSEIKAFASKLSVLWKKRSDIMSQVAGDFMKKWESPNDYDRGNFQGEVMGYVMMTAFIVLVTVGGGAAITGAGRFGNFLKLIQIMDEAGDITAYASKLFAKAKVPADVVSDARRVLEGQLAKAAGSDVAHATRAPRVDTPGSIHGEPPHRQKPDSSHGKHTPGTKRETVTIEGLAQRPKLKWEKNPGGVIRTVDEARKLAIKHGVEIPDDIEFRALADKFFPDDTFASYVQRLNAAEKGFTSWDDFYDTVTDTLSVKIKRSILESDEAIVAVLGHEMYELNQLRRLFDELGGRMPNVKLANLINPGIHGNLHDQAWAEADRLVTAMRKAKGDPP